MKQIMNIQLCLILFLGMVGMPLFAQTNIFFESYKNEEIQVSFRDSIYRATLDENGVGTIFVPASLKPDYAIIYGPRGVYQFYLLPSGKQRIERYQDGRMLFSGAGKDINEYLTGPVLSSLNFDYSKDFKSFFTQWKGTPEKLQAYLDSIDLPDEFKYIERKRLYYVACNLLQVYPLYHNRLNRNKPAEPIELYYSELKKMVKEDTEANSLWEYRQTMKNMIQTLSAYNTPESKPINQLRKLLRDVQANVSDNLLKSYLIYTYMYEYVRYNGAEGVDEFLPIYANYVSNIQLKKEFDEIYQKYCRILKGKKAPNFSLPDINGNVVSLHSFLGRYVYVDVWATWCGPCCRELPRLQKLEEKYEKKPITFIAISIDNNEAAWKKKVQSEDIKGIQLHVGKGSTFQNDYQVSLIPRFILIDPEGKIINENMTRPSDKNTEILLDSLLK